MDQNPSYNAALSGKPRSATGAACATGLPDLLYNRCGNDSAPGNLAGRWTQDSDVVITHRDGRAQVAETTARRGIYFTRMVFPCN